jgi:hypothetical protein
MLVRFSRGCTTSTRTTWKTTNTVKASMPRKWMLRATWRPPSSLMYQGKLAAMAGDIAAPVTSMTGPSTKTTKP